MSEAPGCAASMITCSVAHDRFLPEFASPVRVIDARLRLVD